ncbi:MAG TPA: glycoside hydrolase family 2 TIM barrel-domain containing protein [Candidatus Hydrogenedentes bacterium]|nr:glycoside hydrolase family 2 TIM barrel-domain containing protein [Candidatus Hydrogenedentota bacterium]
MSIPRPEYPRPQFVREQWLCLNGEWEFEMDPGDTGLERGLLDRSLKDRIQVPFCPESRLSGIGHTDFMTAVWYRRSVKVPAEWAGSRILLHFQAVEYDATVWVNGEEVARHRGGFTPFTCDITQQAGQREAVTIVVRARDYTRRPQPLGKQSHLFQNHGCLYTRTTGIWQTVWMEPVPETALLRPRITPDVSNASFHIEQRLSRNRRGLYIRARITDEAGDVSGGMCAADHDFSGRIVLPVPEPRRHLWKPGDPHLYGILIELVDESENVIDRLESYAGLRSVAIDGKAVRINGEAVFQRLVLDQGYYPEGILTAPSDTALQRDIELSIQAGFNGARLHQKIFEERFLYHADRLGYLVWGEFPDWGCAEQGPVEDHQHPGATYMTQWLEVLERDYSHPSIVGWCPLNETWQPVSDRITVLDDITRGMFLAAKAMDGTRPVLDASGYSHRVHGSDIYDSHDYDQNPETFLARHESLLNEQPFVNKHEDRDISIPYRGQPYFVSEFGGIWWNPKARPGEDSWGYGERPKTIEEFYVRFAGLCGALLDNPNMFGYCYTQLTDVFQEQNGIYLFDRGVKFNMARLRGIQQRRAAIECE